VGRNRAKGRGNIKKVMSDDRVVKFVIRGERGYYSQSSDGYISGVCDKIGGAVLYDTYEQAETAIRNLKIGGWLAIDKVFMPKYPYF
jgi:hypothetical protein